jgi:hypothetical protein
MYCLEEERRGVKREVAAFLGVLRRDVAGITDCPGDGDDSYVDQQCHEQSEPTLIKEEPARVLIDPMPW